MIEPIPFAGLIELEETMKLEDLIEALDQRYGNPYAKECSLIQEAIAVLREIKDRPAINKEDGLVCAKCYQKIGQ